jgi:hypothetical protein
MGGEACSGGVCGDISHTHEVFFLSTLWRSLHEEIAILDFFEFKLLNNNE